MEQLQYTCQMVLPMNKMQIFKVFTSFANIETNANHVGQKQPVPRRLKHKNVKQHSLRDIHIYNVYTYTLLC